VMRGEEGSKLRRAILFLPNGILLDRSARRLRAGRRLRNRADALRLSETLPCAQPMDRRRGALIGAYSGSRPGQIGFALAAFSLKGVIVDWI